MVDKEKGILEKGASHAVAQVFLKIRKPIAHWIAKNIPEPLKDRATTWASALPVISTVIATLSPDEGIWKHIDEFQQDLFDAIEQELKNPTNGEDGDKATLKIVQEAAEIKTTVDVLMAVGELDPAVAQDFTEWYLDDQANFTGFNRLIKGASKEAIKVLAATSRIGRERLIAQFKEERHQTYLELRHEIDHDTPLTTRVNDFLTRLNAGGNNRTREFWAAVERRAFPGIEEFKSMMDMKDEIILVSLNMPEKTVARRMSEMGSKAVSSVTPLLNEAVKAGHRRLDALDRLDRQRARTARAATNRPWVVNVPANTRQIQPTIRGRQVTLLPTWQARTWNLNWLRRLLTPIRRPIMAIREGFNFNPFR